MIIAFLRIRILQLCRELKALGWWRVAVVAALAAGVLALFYRWMHQPRGAWHGAAAVALAVAAVHLMRGDRRFLLTATGSVGRVTTAEYLVFTAPFIAMGICSPGWPYAAALPFFYVLLGFVSPAGARKAGAARNFFFLAPDNFEWRAGIRMNLWPLAVVYLACLGFLRFPYVSLYLWWVLLAMVIPFYRDCEPRAMLQAPELPPARFLGAKIRGQLKDYAYFSAPVFLGYALFHPAGAWIAAAVWLLSAVNFCWFILAKYAAYEPSTKTPGGQLVVTMVHLALLIPMAGPFMLPVPMVLAVIAYRKSLHRLNPYLDDYR